MSENVEVTETLSASAVTPAVTTAFGFGWQMARLYEGPLSSNAELRLGSDLPGLSELPAAQRVQLGLAQADVALARMRGFLADTSLPTTDAVRAATKRQHVDGDAIRKAILELHIALLVQLTAADYRVGKAYGLGRALADTCASASGDPVERQAAFEHHLEPHRVDVIAAWLNDLKTVLPAHSSQSVADSLGRWKRWAGAVGLRRLEPATVTKSAHELHRCGQQWRAILSGEKSATDLLTIADYVNAACGTLARAGAVARSLAWQLWLPLVLAVGLVVTGVLLIVANNSTAQVLAGLGTIAGGLGITWRSAAGSVGHLSVDLIRPLWDAQLDLTIGNRLTPLPQQEYVSASPRPADRWRRAWRELRTPDAQAPEAVAARRNRSLRSRWLRRVWVRPRRSTAETEPGGQQPADGDA